MVIATTAPSTLMSKVILPTVLLLLKVQDMPAKFGFVRLNTMNIGNISEVMTNVETH